MWTFLIGILHDSGRLSKHHTMFASVDFSEIRFYCLSILVIFLTHTTFAISNFYAHSEHIFSKHLYLSIRIVIIPNVIHGFWIDAETIAM